MSEFLMRSSSQNLKFPEDFQRERQFQSSRGRNEISKFVFGRKFPLSLSFLLAGISAHLRLSWRLGLLWSGSSIGGASRQFKPLTF
jgi:hypothetical protein